MSRTPVQDDLHDYSTCASPDEERLLTLYRRLDWEARTELLYRITRRGLTPCFSIDSSADQDAANPTAWDGDLQELLLSICPLKHFGAIRQTLHTPYLQAVWPSEWRDIASVILGATEQDGQRADELCAAVLSHCQAVKWRGTVPFQRSDALALIEAWREAALQLVFKPAPE